MSRLVAGNAESLSTGRHPGYVCVFFNLSELPLRGAVNGVRGELLPASCCISAPENVEQLFYTRGCTLRILNLYVSPEDFISAVEDTAAGVPAGVTSALTGSGESLLNVSRMTAEMRRIIEQMDQCPFHGSLRRLYLEGKVLELLALRLAQLPSAAEARPVPARSLRLKGRLEEAQAILRQRMKSPPSLHDLSREVAMSASVLKTAFHEVFGVTVFAYLRDLRLERAREMLLDQGVSVKEVSWAVGYASLSHFARAFRQRFGVSPRAWARPRSFS
jgi:AraC-like DNA-binding protein